MISHTAFTCAIHKTLRTADISIFQYTGVTLDLTTTSLKVARMYSKREIKGALAALHFVVFLNCT